MTVTGSCHCGNVGYMIDGPAPSAAVTCNCSMCRRKGSLLHFVPAEAVTVTGRESLTGYTFNTHKIRHQFCATCGVAPFSEGTAPDGRAMVALNLRCADALDLDSLEISHFDGAAL
ncbi:GFA family protein [Sphingomonas sp.]|uniref:GFA family protein n=1 Tax=Sphingomonas sp. TaxID=28214 RepID=UPI002CF2A0B3|nr:GFA family protein [Sphingomonas sp.]HWK34754.1 GFA family protein [Sphingomonas sp.]